MTRTGFFGRLSFAIAGAFMVGWLSAIWVGLVPCPSPTAVSAPPGARVTVTVPPIPARPNLPEPGAGLNPGQPSSPAPAGDMTLAKPAEVTPQAHLGPNPPHSAPPSPTGPPPDPRDDYPSVGALLGDAQALGSNTAIMVDGQMVRSGFGPALCYTLRSTGEVTRAPCR